MAHQVALAVVLVVLTEVRLKQAVLEHLGKDLLVVQEFQMVLFHLLQEVAVAVVLALLVLPLQLELLVMVELV
jgi:hypothetical protein